MKTNLCVCAFGECMKVRGGLAITTTNGPKMSRRNVSGGRRRIYGGPARSEREKECEH